MTERGLCQTAVAAPARQNNFPPAPRTGYNCSIAVATKVQRVRLALFFLVVIGAFAVFALVVAGDTLFRQYDRYFIRYTDESVAGLQSGGTVIYQGIAVGSIESIRIDPEDIQSIVVTISIERGTPIKDDVRAQIVPVGITGLSQVQLSGGTRDADTLSPGGFIPPSPSTVAQVTETIQSVLEGMERVLLDVSGVLSQIDQDSVGSILSRIDSILAANETRISDTLEELNLAAAGLARLTTEAEQLVASTRRGTEAAFAGLETQIEVFAAEIESFGIGRIGEEVSALVGQGTQIVSEVDLIVRRNRSTIDRSIDLLQDTLRLLNNAAFQINADPSVLVIPVERR